MSSNDSSQFKIVAFSADPWESCLPFVRYRGPETYTRMKVIKGNSGDDVYLEKIHEADIVLIQRDFPRFVKKWGEIVKIAREQQIGIVYEIDDLLFDLPQEHPSSSDLENYLHSILWALVESDLVTTTTQYLHDYLRPLNINIRILPNFLNDQIWSFRTPNQNKTNDQVTVGYMGGHTHDHDLRMVLPVLEALLEKYQHKIQIVFWGNPPPNEIKDHPNVNWTNLDIINYQEFAKFFNQQQLDIAIAPLMDNQLNRAKSEIKFLEYSAIGASGVYSKLPPYEQIVTHGHNGYLASDLDEWEHWLSYLIDNPDERLSIAQSAQDTVKQNWLLSKNANKWLDTYLAIPKRSTDYADRIKRFEKIHNVTEITQELLTSYQLIISEERKSHQKLTIASEEQTSIIAGKDKELEIATGKISEYQDLLDEKFKELQKAQLDITHYQGELTRQTRLLEEEQILYQSQIAEKDRQYEELEASLNQILDHRGWKFVQSMQKIRLRLIPLNSRREILYQSILRFFDSWRK